MRLEPTTTQNVNEHSSIWPSWPGKYRDPGKHRARTHPEKSTRHDKNTQPDETRSPAQQARRASCPPSRSHKKRKRRYQTPPLPHSPTPPDHSTPPRHPTQDCPSKQTLGHNLAHPPSNFNSLTFSIPLKHFSDL